MVIGIDIVNLITSLFQHFYGFCAVLFKMGITVNLMLGRVAGKCGCGTQGNNGSQ